MNYSRIKKFLILLSIVCNISSLFLVFYYIHIKGGQSYLLKKFYPTTVSASSSENTPYYLQRETLFKSLPKSQEEIIFLGDSITDGCEWDELFHNSNIVNRGIGGDSTQGILNRLNEITSDQPSKVFIMIGINDLHLLNKKSNDIIENYKTILETIKNDSPNTKIHIQSVLPINSTLIKDANNQDIIQLNTSLKLLAKEKNCIYIDLYSKFCKDGELNLDYSNDGIHLLGNGYLFWRDSIKKYLE